MEKSSLFINKMTPVKKENVMDFGLMDVVLMEKDVNLGIKK